MLSRFDIAKLLGYDYRPIHSSETNAEIDRLVIIQDEQGLSAMMDAITEIILARPEPEPVDPRWTHPAFLADLTRLSREHGLIIEGCGCCGSPWISEISPDSEGRYTASTHWQGAETIKWEETKDERG